MNLTLKTSLQKRSNLIITGGIAFFAILLAAVIGGVIIALMGINPGDAYRHFLAGAFGNVYGFGETINKFTPLLCSALAFSIAMKSGFMNIGAEGQFGAGALCAVLVALRMGSVPPGIAIGLTLLVGLVGGAVWASIAGLLRIYFNANELLTTMMLNYVMQFLLALLLHGPLKNPESNMEQTPLIPTTARLPVILDGSRLHLGVFVAIAALVLIWFLQSRTTIGFEMRLSGANEKAALYAGVRQRRALIAVILISGALGGLGGSLELMGNQHKMMEGLTAGFGFDGIGIAVMGQYNPVGMFLTTLLFAALRTGTASMQRGVGVPTPILFIMQGTVIVTVITSKYFVDKINSKVATRRIMHDFIT